VREGEARPNEGSAAPRRPEEGVPKREANWLLERGIKLPFPFGKGLGVRSSLATDLRPKRKSESPTSKDSWIFI
jgi:hypothetical protein